MLSDQNLSLIYQTCNFYLCLCGYVVAFAYAFVYTTSKLKQLRIEPVDQLPTYVAEPTLVTQLYDKIARVRGGLSGV